MAISTPPLPPAPHARLGSLTLPFSARWLRRIEGLLLAAAMLLGLYAAAGFVVVPRIAKSQIESIARERLGREATVGQVTFNPFSLRATLNDFRLADREPGRTLLQFDRMDVNVSTESLWRRAPVLDAVRVVHPQVEIARGIDGRLSVRDLLERPAAAPEAKEPVFAINNIEVENGSIVLDDLLRNRRIAATRLGIGIPFLSSFPRDARIHVKPRLEGMLDGAPFALTGTSSSPFEDVQRATLEVNLDALALPKYMDYVPLPGGLKVSDGALTTRLALAFVTWKGSPRGITLTGKARLDRLALARKDDSRLAGARSIEVDIADLELFARRAVLDRVAVTAPDFDLRRLPDGSLEMAGLFASPPQAKRGTAAPGAWAWSLAEASVSEGEAAFEDQSVSPRFRTRLTGVTAAVRNLASEGAPGMVNVAFGTEDGARFRGYGSVDVAASSAQGRFSLVALPIAKLRPYYTGFVAADVRSGSLDAGGQFDVAAGAAARWSLTDGSASLSGVDVAIEGEREPLWRMAALEAKGISADLAGRTVVVDGIEGREADIRVLREADGRMHFARLLRSSAAPGGGGGQAPAWRMKINRIALDRMGVDFEDRSVAPAVKLRVAEAKIVARNVDSEPGAEALLEVAARVGSKGRLQVEGTASAQPMAADVQVAANGVDLVPLRGYLQSGTNVIVTGGAATARGRLTYLAAPDAAPSLHYAGNVVVSDLGSLDRPGSRELLRWRTLTVTGADVITAPFKASMDAITLDRFYARLVLDAGAKLNVLQLLAPAAAGPGAAPGGAAKPAAKREPEPEEGIETKYLATETGTLVRPDRPEAAPAPRREEGREIPVSIGRIELTHGEVEYSDFYVQPNYSAHLTDVAGKVSAIGARRVGNVVLTARLDGAAPVEIRGSVNPFAKELVLDIAGTASDVDLPPFTPYSVKYAGYGIEKGKLTMNVHYKVDDRKLEASNKLVLNQLTFGERVESPTATKLPVLLAVKLLKDRDGIIRLDLPISGTIDDPKFSMGRIIVQVILNLLTKAATAPFALLGSIVGGGEQLAYIEFAPGEAALTAASEAKLALLAKALTERPGLRIEAAGRAIPDADADGLRRAALDREIRIRKQKDMAEAGESAPPLDEIPVQAADRAKYLKPIYRETSLPGKPRNFLGMQKDIPAEEMEKRLLAGYAIDDNALRELANHRAQAVREWLTTKGALPADRVFVVAPKLGTEGLKAEGAPTRVDFAIK